MVKTTERRKVENHSICLDREKLNVLEKRLKKLSRSPLPVVSHTNLERVR